MIIFGAGGLALQFYDVLVSQNKHDDILLFEDEPSATINKLFENLQIISDWKILVNAHSFLLGVGIPAVRRRHFEMINAFGGDFEKLACESAKISKFAKIGQAVSVLSFSLIESDAEIGDGVLINAGVYIHHESSIGSFSVLSPGCKLLGKVKIGKECFIGASAVILPRVSIGDNVVVAAGSVVISDVPANSRVKGVPAELY